MAIGDRSRRRRRPDARTFELGHPYQRVGLTLPTEVHRKVRHQRSGRNVHRFLIAQQRGAQALLLFELDDIEAGAFQRDRHHLERIGTVGLGHLE